MRMNEMVREGRKHAATILGENLAPLTAERPKEHDDGRTIVLTYSGERKITLRFRKCMPDPLDAIIPPFERTDRDLRTIEVAEVVYRSLNFVARPKEQTKATRKKRVAA